MLMVFEVKLLFLIACDLLDNLMFSQRFCFLSICNNLLRMCNLSGTEVSHFFDLKAIMALKLIR